MYSEVQQNYRLFLRINGTHGESRTPDILGVGEVL